MMVIGSTKVVGEAVVCVPRTPQSHRPNETVIPHPRYHFAVKDLFDMLVPTNHTLRRGVAYQTLKATVLNPKYAANPALRGVQSERVTSVARLLVRLTGKPVEVRFQEATGHNFLYLDKVIERG